MPCYIVRTHEIISHCNSPHEQIKKNSMCRQGNEIQLTERLFLPFGQAWTDTVNLAEMWRGMEIMAFLREKKQKEWQRRKE